MWPIDRNYRASSFEPGRGASWDWGRRTYVMGIINATQDSFSGDGIDGELDKAIALAIDFEACGTHVIDIGGASSRPGAASTPVEIEKSRVVPVIEAVRDAVELPISIDTTWAAVADAALDAGATMVNDISGFLRDPDLASLVSERGVGAVAMHNQRGREHHDVINDVVTGFNETLSVCESCLLYTSPSPRDS